MARKIIIRAKNFRAWFNANLRSSARDIAEHGADCGYPCITYTRDCCDIFDKFADEIWEMAADDAEAMGSLNVMHFVSGFRRADMADSWDGLRNLMVWYACEKVAHEIADAREAA
jgi:hypothetical protein